MMVDEKLVTHDGLALSVGRRMRIFYVDDGLVGSREPEWLQGSISVLIDLLRQYGLVDNVANYKSMTCQPGAIWSGMSEEAVGQWSTGRGAT